ncbi:carbohydrate ABC transporter permease [Vallitalea okinawensis]|uniref:carbohydrate ABC transporter permease n=1 Tax=Vallitalea okinawensis TaxID=2078660 RepID=UPI001FA86B56|nr:sugar ABC transporter permease [Vallitalea okinawensis]
MSLSVRKRKDYFWAYTMIFPTVFGLFIFYIIPFFQTVLYSFTDLGAFGMYSWVGLDNYINLFKDKEVWQAFLNTLIYTVLAVPISVALSILVAALLNTAIKGLTVYRVLYFLPAVTMPAAVALVWRWLYNSQYGLINAFLGFFSIEGQAWISEPDIALYAIVIVGVWSVVGYNMIIILAGMQRCSRTYYEAAEIDGAGSIQKFFNITIPLISPTIFFVVVMSLIRSFQVFEYIYMMVDKSSIALERTQSLVYLYFDEAFVLHEKGYASSIIMVLFVLILIITYFQLKLQKKWVHYEE